MDKDTWGWKIQLTNSVYLYLIRGKAVYSSYHSISNGPYRLIWNEESYKNNPVFFEGLTVSQGEEYKLSYEGVVKELLAKGIQNE